MENTQEKKTTNYAAKVRGFAGHDANYFDRTCQQCKGMHSSFNTVSCPKCGAALSYITTSKGKPFSISEVTVYPMLGAQEDKDHKIITGKKNGLLPVYRVKLFSFMESEVLTPAPEHASLKKGAMIEFIIINHQFIPSWFTKKDNTPCVELLAQIYPQYGDSIKVLAAPKVQESVSYPVNPDGSPAPINTGGTPDEKIAAMEAEIARLKGESAPVPPTPATPAQPPAQLPVQGVTSVDPFELA